MRYLAFATDYDGTLATGGKVAPATLRAIERVKASGRRALLVTGRRLEDLKRVFPEFAIFDSIVAENGAVVYQPSTNDQETLAEPLPRELLAELHRLKVSPLVTGEVIIATLATQKEKVLAAIHNLGLEAQIIFNGEAAMVLPHGINKASGTRHALRRMGLSFHEVVGFGDSENDHSLLTHCECAIAVANAIPAIQNISAHVTQGMNGEGVAEVIEALLETDLDFLGPKLTRNHIELGIQPDGKTAWFPAYGRNLLIAGPSGSGKSTFATGLIERILKKSYQICIIDPEGDYGPLRDVVAIGGAGRAPSVGEILGILEDPGISVSVNLLGIPLLDRPEFLARFLPSLQSMRSRTGRPQWLFIDEAHHLLPSAWGAASLTLPEKLGETVLLTVHPDQVSPAILKKVDSVIAVGPRPDQTLEQFWRVTGRAQPGPVPNPALPEQVIAWNVEKGEMPVALKLIAGHAERIRHLRKYAEGDLGDHSFYFRGPGNRLNLKAQNLLLFTQISAGLDEETWKYHLHHGDYSNWFRSRVKDNQLADETARIEKRPDIGAIEARELICELIRARYAI